MLRRLELRRTILGRSNPPERESGALSLYLLGMVFQGIWWAGYTLLPFVLAKSFSASGQLITFAATFETTCMFFALYWGYMLSRVDRRPWVVAAGVGGRLVFVLTFFVTSDIGFFALMASSYICSSLLYPAQNAVFQACFGGSVRGRVFGCGALVQHVVTVVTSLVAGIAMDSQPDSFRIVFAVIGVCGFIYPVILARLPQDDPADKTAGENGGASLVGPLTPGRILRGLFRPVSGMVRTFSGDRPFLWFEMNFMIYGIAYLMLLPILPVFFRDYLDLSYAEISNARVVIASLGVALFGPLAGWMMDRSHPVRLCRLSFMLVALYPVGLVLANTVQGVKPVYLVYLAFVIYAVGMSGVNVAWNVGSTSFAPPGMGGYYQGLHVGGVGVRGLIGPSLGFSVYHFYGLNAVFYVAVGFFLAASASSALLWRWMEKRRVSVPADN